jgi:hypothetical protein
MSDVLYSALHPDFSLAVPNHNGTPVLRLENDIDVLFYDNHFDVCQSINLIIRVSPNEKLFYTKYKGIGIVTRAEEMLLAEGYTKFIPSK